MPTLGGMLGVRAGGEGQMPRKVSLQVLNVDLENEGVLERIAAHLDDLLWSEVDGRVCVDVFANEKDLVCAAVDVACRIRTHLSGSLIEQIDDDLVGIPDIAARTRLNRETIRSWSNGTRGPGGFPPPVGSIGGGQRGSAKVWRWRDVNKWLGDSYELDDGFDYPSQAEVSEINAHLMRLEQLTHPAIQNGPIMAGAFAVSAPIRISTSPRTTVTSPSLSRVAAENPIASSQHIMIGSKS